MYSLWIFSPFFKNTLGSYSFNLEYHFRFFNLKEQRNLLNKHKKIIKGTQIRDFNNYGKEQNVSAVIANVWFEKKISFMF